MTQDGFVPSLPSPAGDSSSCRRDGEAGDIKLHPN